MRSLLDRPLSRLLPVYLGWSLVYLFALWALSPDPLGGIDHVVLRGGGGFHLWFLPAIGLSLILVGLGLRTIGWGATAAAAAILFAVGLMLNSYIGEVPEDARRNFLFAPLYVLVGAALRHRRPPLDWRLWATVAGLSFLLLVAEEMVAARLTGSALLSHDSMLATPFLGASLFLLTLSIKANDVIGRVAVVCRMTLGIYAVHVLFIVLLGKPLPTQPWQVAGIALSVLAASTLATLALFRFKPLRPLIS